MNKLYWIVCDDKDANVFEGRYQGRTRGEALKFLKQTIGRKTLNGLVFTITEIPVPLIREIVAEILAGGDGSPTANVVPLTRPEPAANPGRYDAFADAAETEPTPAEATPPKAKASKPVKARQSKQTASAPVKKAARQVLKDRADAEADRLLAEIGMKNAGEYAGGTYSVDPDWDSMDGIDVANFLK